MLFAAIIGGIVGAISLLGIFIFGFYMSQCRKLSNRDSETGSSNPSAVVEMKKGSTTQLGPRQFRIEELEQATRDFDESNLIGCGTFGLVYKGMLCDGTIVAIKRRNGYPRQEFIEEVAYLSAICHRNLVTLVGYCQERGFQMLVYEYLPNDSMCSHLYESKTKLEFKQRISIAIGAAKGLCHLHGLQPPVVHGNFKTANVLVDENFIAKVADAGILKLLDKIEQHNYSFGSTSFNAFKDPELEEVNILNEMSDVYSFGIFILELISGKEANNKEAFGSNDTIFHWVQEHLSLNDLIDHRLVGNFTAEGMRDVMKLMIKCISFPEKERPKMENVAMELDQILEMEITRTTVMGEGTATVTLGSKLFTN
ncbi:hypothetical protein ACJIZ3_014118 [Penstemon smallii]|uniref:non-specific serine/threonine protein kinase n=1 Tax=Penstemon smallii TaxID=265156 RepID=A0ABD3RUE2_9LAMI